MKDEQADKITDFITSESRREPPDLGTAQVFPVGGGDGFIAIGVRLGDNPNNDAIVDEITRQAEAAGLFTQPPKRPWWRRMLGLGPPRQ